MRTEVKAILSQLKKVRDKVQGYLDKCDYEPRQEELETELEALDTAIEALNDIE